MLRSIAGALGLWVALSWGCASANSSAPPPEASPDPNEVTAPRVEATPPVENLPVSGSSGEPTEPAGVPHGKRAPCTTDQSCNDDPAVSALRGHCTQLGVCECKEGFEKSPTSDLCRPAPAE